MNLTTLFDAIAGKQKQREQALASDFRGLVTAIATGKQPDPDHVVCILHDPGKTLEDLRAAVELLQTRMAMRTHLNSLPKLQAEEKEIGRQIADADAALARAEDTHQETTYPLVGRLQQVRDAIRTPSGTVSNWSPPAPTRICWPMPPRWPRSGGRRTSGSTR